MQRSAPSYDDLIGVRIGQLIRRYTCKGVLAEFGIEIIQRLFRLLELPRNRQSAYQV